MVAPSVALEWLSIRDFRGIESLDLDFRGPDGAPNNLVVLAGPNGSGKTAVLESVLLALGGDKLAVGPRGRAAIRKGAAGYEIRAGFLGSTCLELRVTDQHSESPSPTEFWYFSSWRAPALIGPVDVSVGKAGRPAARSDANRLKNVKRRLVDAAARAHFRPRQAELLSQYNEWMKAINDAWAEFYPDSDASFTVDLADSPGRQTGAFDVFYERPGAARLEVDSLSAGQLELFLFLAALVLNDERTGIVLIDEPELHLDPQWHRPTMRALLRLQPRAQFIVATHSSEIYDAAQSYERHYLAPEGDPRALLWRPAVAEM